MKPRENEGSSHEGDHQERTGERESIDAKHDGVSNDASRVADAVSMANAMQWISRITTVVLEMVLPGIGGNWLDGKFGTNFLVLVGLALGVTLGIYHLILMTNQNQIKNIKRKKNTDQVDQNPLGRKNNDRNDIDPLDFDQLRKL